jgi:hypothetical protein
MQELRYNIAFEVPVNKLALLVVLVLAGGCATPLQPMSDYDRSQDFSKYRTFAWVSDDALIRPQQGGDEVSALNRRRIADAIEAELTSKGFQKVGAGAEPSFTVAYTVGSRERLDVYSYPEAYRRHPWSWGYPSYFGDRVDVDSYTEGTLAIDIFDGASKRPVWHGRASRRITQKDVEHAAELIPPAVKSILENFPPVR